jgi:hypothetical protein
MLIGAGVLFFARSDSSSTSERKSAEIPEPRLPEKKLFGGYVSASSCQECHPDQYSTWHDSFHRTMTQAVSKETVAAPLSDDEIVLKSRGRTYRFSEDRNRFFVEMVDPEKDLIARRKGWPMPPDANHIRREIVMSTGSHHYQTYWVNGSRGNQLWQVPWIYHLKDERWIPVEDAFIAPPGDYRRITDWNDNCIQCHSVGGRPNYRDADQLYQTQVVDFGIACEACHGPGEDHVRFHKSPPEARDRLTDRIVNPMELNHRRASQVCGQCHSSSLADQAEFLAFGHRFRPGDDLTDSRTINDYDDEVVQSRPSLSDAFWGDGTIRLAGREYNGLHLSACFLEGEASCLSCHSLHSYESRDDQLGPIMRTDTACLQCHENYAPDLSAHTHHAPESAGSRCYNCHMPHSSFGLFKSIRSHRIDSPTAKMTTESGRPNACMLCHADRSLPWIGRHLTDWYGHEPAPISDFAREHSAAVMFLLSGDAVQRAVTAWNLGKEATRAASGEDWQVPLLAELLNDSYSVVRYVAIHSLRKYPGMDALEYDFLAPEAERDLARRQALEIWDATKPDSFPSERAKVLISPDGQVDEDRIRRLQRLRDDRPIVLPE